MPPGLSAVPESAPLRALIVDDERLARRLLRTMLSAEPGVTIVGEASNATDALELLREERPDVVFLDVQMPGADGFDLLARAGAEDVAHVVFVTAHDRYACRAFDVDAVDYLLKPFDHLRLRQTLARVRGRRGEDVSRRMLGLLERLGTTPGLQRLLVRSGSAVRFVDVKDVVAFESADNYVTARTADGGEHLLRTTLQRLETSLDEARFVRIHRRHIVALRAIRECRPAAGGDHEVVLDDGRVLPVGRQYRDRLLVWEIGT